MDEDFGTPEAVAVLFELAARSTAASRPKWRACSRRWGLPGLLQAEPQKFLQAGARRGCGRRIAAAHAKAAKNWAEADRIRKELLEQGIVQGLGARPGKRRQGLRLHAIFHQLCEQCVLKHLDTMEFEQLPLVADLPVPMGPAAPLPVAPLGRQPLLSLRVQLQQAVAPKAAAPKIHLDLPDGVPAYWAEACRQLMRRDRVLKRLIPQLGSQALLPCGQEQAFATLARSIVGQQISAKSAKTLWNKFAKLPAHAARAGAQAQGGRYAWRGTVGAQGGLSGRSGAALHRASPAWMNGLR
jgi:hypothetical protein